MGEFGFILKKFITFFVEPFGMVFTLFVLGLYFLVTKKEYFAKIFLSSSLLLLFLFSYQPFSNMLVTNLENKYPKYEQNQEVKYIVVLGANHNNDTSKPLSSRIANAGIKRVLEGISIHKSMDKSKIIFTGYKGRTDISYAKVSASLAIALGVKKEDIIISTPTKDTKEEAIFIKELLKDEPFVLVTSATHMSRSMQLFNSQGLYPIPAPTDFYKKKFTTLLSAPGIGNMHISQVAMHEYLGILWNSLTKD